MTDQNRGARGFFGKNVVVVCGGHRRRLSTTRLGASLLPVLACSVVVVGENWGKRKAQEHRTRTSIFLFFGMNLASASADSAAAVAAAVEIILVNTV